MEKENINIVYTDEFENLLKEEAEKAECMSLLHSKAYEKFNGISIRLNIPVIVISSAIGFLSQVHNIVPNQNVYLGAISIFVAILKTIDNFFDYTKRSECHRMTSLNYNKISKLIQIQLSLEKDVRIQAGDLLKVISSDIQNIKDAEPLIPDDIIDRFKSKYKDEPTAKPSITNGLTMIKINKNTYKEEKMNLNY
jgi:hypothetical protein